MTYTLLVNLKAYQSATDTSAQSMLETLAEATMPSTVSLIVAVNPVDLRLASTVDVEVFAEHVDPVTYGSHTGHVLPASADRLGASGTLINHSECQRSLETIDATIDAAEDNNLTTMVCAPDPETIDAVAAMQPSYVAVEPPELIGGNTSVSAAQPEIIKASVANASNHETPLLCGAGVKDTEDVKQAVELGAQGILVASGVVKAADPKAAVERLAQGFTL
mgnify:CR=1 FL=1